MAVYSKITDLIGNTPLLELSKTEKKYGLKAKIIAKLEAFNPAGSIKDRIAYAMIKDALADGRINQDSTIIEPTSGNTGIGLAMVGAALGLKVIIVLPATMSEERRNTIKAYGAQLVVTDGSKGMKGSIAKAQELQAATPNSWIPNQFDNPSNVNIHYKTTGPEIWKDTDGSVDILVGGVGTGGTVSGAGHYLKEQKSSVKVIAVEPAASPVLSGGKAGPHKIQGIGPGFEAGNVKREYIDEIVTVSDEDALNIGREVAHAEGVFLGISGGAAIAAAINVAKRPENAGKNIVVVIPDSGDRYLSTALYKQD
ncbi:MAG TPA: cysteine synthase A [Succinivibrionaceae bacterium]|nr:cysteine synthase A [Succinivibrionaceae bacterium]